MYKVIIESKEFLTSPDIVNGLDIKLIGQNRYHVIYKNQSVMLEIESVSKETQQVVIRVDGKTYTCAIQSPLIQTISNLQLHKTQKTEEKNLRAPMAGLILQVHVNPGDHIHKGDKLVTLEAMKMENVIKAAHDVVIGNVLVLSGEKVEKSQELISFV